MHVNGSSVYLMVCAMLVRGVDAKGRKPVCCRLDQTYTSREALQKILLLNQHEHCYYEYINPLIHPPSQVAVQRARWGSWRRKRWRPPVGLLQKSTWGMIDNNSIIYKSHNIAQINTDTSKNIFLFKDEWLVCRLLKKKGCVCIYLCSSM